MKKIKYLMACLLCASLMSCEIIDQPEPDTEETNEQDPPALSIGAVSGVVEGGMWSSTD